MSGQVHSLWVRAVDAGLCGESGENCSAPLLERFLIGPENLELESTLLACCEAWWKGARSGWEWRPETPWVLTIAGPSGSGKTHLVQGLCQWWTATDSTSRVRQEPAVDFARAYRDADQLGDLDAFRDRYESWGIWVVEDVHRLTEQPGAQLELARLIEARTDAMRPTICSMVTPVSSANDWSAQLTSRLAGGLVAEVEYPTRSTRLAWIDRWSQETGRRVEGTVAEQLADRDDLGIPQLTGALLSLAAGSVGDEPSRLSLTDVRLRIDQVAPERAVSLADIVKATARQCRLRVADIRGKSRRTGNMRARSIAMYLAREMTGLSLERIGEYFSGRDHTTVIHACRKIERLLEREVELKSELEGIRIRMQSSEPA
ncbi:MAG: helix-turn-helix domain-containing protein [Pirellulales bacterium]